MFGLVVKFRDETFTAVAPTKGKLHAWRDDLVAYAEEFSGPLVAWRMRDVSGWCDGQGEGIEEFAPSGGNSVTVLW